MKPKLSRREFTGLMGLGTSALMFPGLYACKSKTPSLKIGYTFINFGYQADVLEEAVRTISALGFYSFETFGGVIERWENEYGGIGKLIDKYEIPIQSAFCGLDVLDESRIDEEAARMDLWCKLLKKYGGKVIEFTGNGRRNEEYNYMDHRDTIVKATNAYARVAAKHDLTFAYHQHTDTPIETREEIYDLVENVDTDIVKLGPDIGQLLKGGTDPVEFVRNFLPMIKHVHLKDFDGGDHWAGYCSLGQGKVNLPGVLDLLETDNFDGSVMVELDPDNPSMPAAETAKASRDYLVELGYKFNI
jgi:inosose dehydratase